MNTVLANVVHHSQRSTGFALNILVIHALGDAISPPVIGAISDTSGGLCPNPANGSAGDLKTAFLVMAIFLPVSGALWLWGMRYEDEDTKKADDASKAVTAATPTGGVALSQL